MRGSAGAGGGGKDSEEREREEDSEDELGVDEQLLNAEGHEATNMRASEFPFSDKKRSILFAYCSKSCVKWGKCSSLFFPPLFFKFLFSLFSLFPFPPCFCLLGYDFLRE